MVTIDEDKFTTLVDEVSDTECYVGKAARGSATSAEVWSIQKISVSGNVTTIAWPSKSDRFEFVWDDRATYTYS